MLTQNQLSTKQTLGGYWEEKQSTKSFWKMPSSQPALHPIPYLLCTLCCVRPEHSGNDSRPYSVCTSRMFYEQRETFLCSAGSRRGRGPHCLENWLQRLRCAGTHFSPPTVPSTLEANRGRHCTFVCKR